MTDSQYPRVPDDAAVALREVQDLRASQDPKDQGIVARAVVDVEGYGSVQVVLRADFLGAVTVHGSKASGGERGTLGPQDIRHDVRFQDRVIAEFGKVLGGRFHRRPAKAELRERNRQKHVEDQMLGELEQLDPTKAAFLRAAAAFYDEQIRRGTVAARIASARSVVGINDARPRASSVDLFPGIKLPDDPNLSVVDRARAAIAALRATGDVAGEPRS